MYSEIAHNKLKSIVIMTLFVLIIAALADLVSYAYGGGSPAVLIGVVVGAIIYSVIAYFVGMRMSLALNSAKEITKADNPRLWRIVENLSITDGLPMPKVYIMDDPSPNAFATGRDPNHSAVCATSGLLEIMDDNELTGVFAHEMSHVKNYDSRVSLIAFALTAAISLIADIFIRIAFFSDDREENQIPFFLGIIAAFMAPLLAFLLQMAVSRQREYLADASGALATRYPEGLASALRKIAVHGSTLRKQNTATAHFFFANPLKAHSITNLFSTHPPIEERIKRLENMDSHA